jgi:ATP-dependent phosphoenolpyruvate carboxykinase
MRLICCYLTKSVNLTASYRVDPYFGVSVPQSVPGVETTILDPARTWLSADDFAATASRLVDMFRANFVKFEPFVDDTVLGAQPSVTAHPFLELRFNWAIDRRIAV